MWLRHGFGDDVGFAELGDTSSCIAFRLAVVLVARL